MSRVVLSCYTGLAPYQGQDATDSFSTNGCDPTKEYVPPQMKADLDGGIWTCYGNGCNDKGNSFQSPGTDIAWIPSNQIPVTP